MTPSKIFSTGLFGKNNVVVTYAGVGSVVLFAGQLADQYTVEGEWLYQSDPDYRRVQQVLSHRRLRGLR